MDETIFTKIINREIPAEIVWENDKVIVFLDINPHVDGQILVVPKVQVDHFFDLQDDDYNEVFRIVKLVAPILKKVYSSKRVTVIIEGFDVPHVHVKLYPVMNASDTMNEVTPELKSRIPDNRKKLEEAFKNLK